MERSPESPAGLGHSGKGVISEREEAHPAASCRTESLPTASSGTKDCSFRGTCQDFVNITALYQNPRGQPAWRGAHVLSAKWVKGRESGQSGPGGAQPRPPVPEEPARGFSPSPHPQPLMSAGRWAGSGQVSRGRESESGRHPKRECDGDTAPHGQDQLAGEDRPAFPCWIDIAKWPLTFKKKIV